MIHKTIHIPEHIRSFFPRFPFLCADKLTRNSTVIAGITKDMSLIKQVLLLSKHPIKYTL